MAKLNEFLPKFGLRPDEAAFALGSEKLFEECVCGGWIKPVIKRHKLVLFDRADVANCWSRILGGEAPPSLAESKATKAI
jgi:hypothetical protein